MNKKTDVGRVILSIVMILVGVFCLYSLTEGFTIGILLIGIIGVVLGIFNLYRVFKGKGQAGGGSTRTRAPKNDDNFSL
jgi:uncharacterized membrane protein HdeD (DUF308 family)